MTSHRLIPIFCCLIAAVLYSVYVNNDTEAQLNQNMLESIVNQTDVSTTPQIKVGNEPVHISYLGNTLRTADSVYVANQLSDTVSVINLATNAVKNILVGDWPLFVYPSPNVFSTDSVYVANYVNDTVSVIDTISNTVIKNITVGNGPNVIDTSPFAYYILYVGNKWDNNVSVIDTISNTVIKNITVGNGPTVIATFPLTFSGRTTNANSSVYVANSLTNTVSVINPITNTVIKNITVGDNPTDIAKLSSANTVYVVNSFNDTVSVINGTTNTVIKNITVGDNPTDIATSPIGDSVYVANYDSGSVSVINGTTNTVIKNITVGDNPTDIATSPIGDSVYIANKFSGTISVINGTTNTVIKNIIVGDGPNSIATSPLGDSVYVTNQFSDTISIIDVAINKVVAGVTFDTIPFRGGQIVCNDLNAPINRYFYVASGTECIAKARSGFEFDSWVETFDDNSTRTINASTPADSPLAALRDLFSDEPIANLTRTVSVPSSSNSPLILEALRDAFSDSTATNLTRTVSTPALSDSPLALVALRDAFTGDPAATLAVNRYGNFTAYFKALPPAVPAEYIASLFTVVVTAIVGSLLIPSAISWSKSKKQTSRLNSFHQQMAPVYADDKVDETDTGKLDRLNNDISDSYTAGKISNEQYTHLKNEVSTALQEIFKKRIASITERDIEDLGKINNEITDAYSNGKLNNEHYNNLKNEISNTYQKFFKKRIETIIDPNTEAINDIKNDIEDAYSDRKITELDYNLLIGKISRMLDKK